MLVDVVYRSETVAVEAATTEELALRFLEAFPSATAPRFLVRGTQLHEGPLPPPARGSAALRVMAISATVEEKAAVQAARPARLRDDLEVSGPLRPPARAPLQARRRNNLSDEYGFASIEVLPGFADGDAARAILERLAADPGIASVMRARRWRVPVLGEMYPEGRVGTDPVCVLGYNVNRGQRINLRVRTDGKRVGSRTAPVVFSLRLNASVCLLLVQTWQASVSMRSLRMFSGTSSPTTRSASTRTSSTRS